MASSFIYEKVTETSILESLSLSNKAKAYLNSAIFPGLILSFYIY